MPAEIAYYHNAKFTVVTQLGHKSHNWRFEASWPREKSSPCEWLECYILQEDEHRVLAPRLLFYFNFSWSLHQLMFIKGRNYGLLELPYHTSLGSLGLETCTQTSYWNALRHFGRASYNSSINTVNPYPSELKRLISSFIHLVASPTEFGGSRMLRTIHLPRSGRGRTLHLARLLPWELRVSSENEASRVRTHVCSKPVLLICLCKMSVSQALLRPSE